MQCTAMRSPSGVCTLDADNHLDFCPTSGQYDASQTSQTLSFSLTPILPRIECNTNSVSFAESYLGGRTAKAWWSILMN